MSVWFAPFRGFIALVAALACSAACTQAGHASGPEHELVQGPHIPTGTHVAIRLTRALDLSSSTPGALFEGVVVDSLRTPEGVALVPSGAIVRGTVHWGPHTGRIYLRGATVETDIGPLAMNAALAPRPTPAGAVRNGEPSRSRADDALARAEGATDSMGTSAADHISAGTEVDLVLVRPVLAPTASVVTSP